MRASRACAFLLVAFMLSACTQWEYRLGTPLGPQGEREWNLGTGLPEVLAELGPPQRLASSEPGYIMAWESWRIRENSLGFSLGALGADFLSVDIGESRVNGEFLVLAFDREHRLAAAGYSRWDVDSGGGRALQPFISIAEVVDVDDLLDVMPQHAWGGGLLEPLPRVLNSHSRPGLGNTGIQQRGTPRAAGQETLEMR